MTSKRGRKAMTMAFVAATIAVSTAFSSPALGAAAIRVDSARASRDSASVAVLPESLSGKSGKLWFRLVSERLDDGVTALRRLFGDSAAGRPGIYTASDSAVGHPFSFVRLVPFADKKKGAIGPYRLGSWPAERRLPRSEAYRNPEGFIEVPQAAAETRVSEHFRLSDFLTKDQHAVWPKYLVLRESLLDKLELVIEELRARGLRADRMVVLSGFRTPQYNAKGVGPGGRAKDSRHQFGDAADVFVDADGNGRMDDLNGDGRVDSRDTRYLASVVDAVEQANPDLVGGLGLYGATRAHGPFVHVDVRGQPSRWSVNMPVARKTTKKPARSGP